MVWLIIIVLAIGVYIFFQSRSTKVDISILPEQFVVIDVETTGFDPSKDEIIEIGAVKVNRDSDNHTTFHALIKPSKKIPKIITEITGITQEMIDKDGENIESVLKELIDFIGDLRLVAYNAEFDIAFLKMAAIRFGLTIKNKNSCALKMARRAFPGLESYKLVDLAHIGGLSTTGSHRALKDCELTITVYTSAAFILKSVK